MAQAFISYARTDEDPAKRLAVELERRGVHVASIDRLVSPGESWVSHLQNAIAESDLVLVLVSPESERSQGVASETAFAVSQAEKGRTRVVPVLLSPRAEPPFFLRHIQGITLFDPERSQRQLDQLVRSLESGPAGTGGEAPRKLEGELKYLKASRDALRTEMAAQVSRRAAWSSTIAATITALAALATALAGLVSFSDVATDAVRHWGLPFGLGVFASVLGFLLSAWFRRRLRSRDPHKEQE